MKREKRILADVLYQADPEKEITAQLRSLEVGEGVVFSLDDFRLNSIRDAATRLKIDEGFSFPVRSNRNEGSATVVRTN